jgi:hypothetical protein
VSGLIAVQFPDLAGRMVTRLGAGWDHELFGAAGEWISRFPRRAQRAAWLTREIEITAIVTETLRSMIPIFERTGEPCGASRIPSLTTGGCRARALTRLAPATWPAWPPTSAPCSARCTASTPAACRLRQTAGTPAVG